MRKGAPAEAQLFAARARAVLRRRRAPTIPRLRLPYSPRGRPGPPDLRAASFTRSSGVAMRGELFAECRQLSGPIGRPSSSLMDKIAKALKASSADRQQTILEHDFTCRARRIAIQLEKYPDVKRGIGCRIYDTLSDRLKSFQII
jgi:hypothetical protein